MRLFAYILAISSATFGPAAAGLADDATPSAIREEVALACVAIGARPTKKDCAGRLVIARDSDAWSERFKLSLNDPIEYFSYAGRYRWPVGLFVAPPVLGGLRDRFIDDDPFGNTLLFSTVVGGGGLDVAWQELRLIAGVNGVYVKQRYAPTVVHSDELLDPEAERTFGIAQFGGLAEATLSWRPATWLTLEIWGSRLEVARGGARLRDDELAWRARWILMRWAGGAAGFTAERYRRWQTMRLDGAQTNFDLSRAGVFVEF